MIIELLLTILPTLLILLIFSAFAIIITDISKSLVFKALLTGIITVVPALITMKLLGIIITITVPIVIPLIIFQILSALNEEFFKYLSIKKFNNKYSRTIPAVFIGGGFALCETLYLTMGNTDLALIRTYTSLPLHIITSLILSRSIKQKKYFLLAVLLHLSYNLLISTI